MDHLLHGPEPLISLCLANPGQYTDIATPEANKHVIDEEGPTKITMWSDLIMAKQAAGPPLSLLWILPTASDYAGRNLNASINRFMPLSY